MMIARRRFLLGSTGIVLTGQSLLAEFGEPFEVEIPNVPLDPGLPLGIAATASQKTTCEIQVINDTGQAVFAPRTWEIDPKRVSSLERKVELPSARKGYTIKAKMHPKADRPSMGFALIQDTKIDQQRLQAMAAQVPFVADPAAAPGHFTIDLALPSNVNLDIWKGLVASGPPMYRAASRNLSGSNPIPWDLNAAGHRVGPGQYLGWLTCTPLNPARRPTYCFATFRVT
jgi:hypothetical protein